MASVLYLVGALVTALAPDLVVMVIGRFVFGIGIGLVIYINLLNARLSSLCSLSFIVAMIF